MREYNREKPTDIFFKLQPINKNEQTPGPFYNLQINEKKQGPELAALFFEEQQCIWESLISI